MADSQLETLRPVYEARQRLEDRLGRKPVIVMASTNKDLEISSSSNQLAAQARYVGFHVVAPFTQLSPDCFVKTAVDHKADLVAVTTQRPVLEADASAIVKGFKAAEIGAPLVVAAIMDKAQAEAFKNLGVSEVFTPPDYELPTVLLDMTHLILNSEVRP